MEPLTAAAEPARRVPWLAALLVATFLFLGTVSMVVYRDHPFSQDEHAYLFQARNFARGRMALALKPEDQALKDSYLIFDRGSLYSKYPPGHSLLLTPGVMIELPGLITPLLSVLALWALYRLAATFVSPAAALAAVALAATNSYFVGYGASYFSQPAALLVLTAGLLAARTWLLAPRPGMAAIFGGIVGFGILVRQLDALCLFLACAVPLLHSAVKGRRWRDVGGFVLGSALGVLALVSYNKVLTGRFSISAFPVWEGEFRVQSERAAGFWDNIARVASDYGSAWPRYTIPGFVEQFLPKLGIPLGLLILAGLWKGRDSFRWVVPACLALFIALYTFHPAEGWPQYGARYWYPVLGGLVLVAAMGLEFLRGRLPPRAWVPVVLVCAAWQAVGTARDLREYGRRFRETDRIRRDIRERSPENAIVVLKAPPPEREFPPRLKWQDFHKNFLPGETRLFVFREEEAATVLRAHPGRPVIVYDFAAPKRGD